MQSTDQNIELRFLLNFSLSLSSDDFRNPKKLLFFGCIGRCPVLCGRSGAANDTVDCCLGSRPPVGDRYGPVGICGVDGEW